MLFPWGDLVVPSKLFRNIVALPVRLMSFAARSIGAAPFPVRKLHCGSVRTVEGFLRKSCPESCKFNKVGTRGLDLGCGVSPRNPFGAESSFGIDIEEKADPLVYRADLALERIPFDDGFFSFVSAFDFIEHVPRVCCGGDIRYPFVELMNEIYRVLDYDGIFFAKTPAFPFSEAFRDPTHVNIITEQTFPVYFCVGASRPLARSYGFKGGFRLVSQKWWGSAWLLTLLKKETVR